MAKTMRTPQQAVDNYIKNTAGAQDLWQSRADAADWNSGASSPQSEVNFSQAMQKAIANKTRQTATAATPNSVYKAGIDANPSRYATGTAAAKAKVTAAFGAIMTDIGTARAALPPRGPRGSTDNIMRRGTAIQSALAKNRGKYKARGIAKVSGGA